MRLSAAVRPARRLRPRIVAALAASLAVLSAPVATGPAPAVHADAGQNLSASETAPASRVEIEVDQTGPSRRYVYLVSGQPTVIQGMGLNTRYQQVLSPAQRVARLDADFAALSRMGVNTLVGRRTTPSGAAGCPASRDFLSRVG